MSPSRLAKALARNLKVSWREQPTQHDIEALRANTRRVGLVIRVRWALVAVLVVFSGLAALTYAASVPLISLIDNMLVPAAALLVVIAYNAFYQRTYKQLGNVAILNQAQLTLDILVVTLLVYYSGGVYSWFVSMYLLFILEGAFILPKRRLVWFLVAVASLTYGGVVFSEYFHLLPHVNMPFVSNDLQANSTYVLVRYLWQVTMQCGTAVVGTLMMAAIRQREAELAASSISDDTTGLYNRAYFHRVLGSEVARSRRDGKGLAVVLIDIDEFGEYNRRFGLERGDEMLRLVASLILERTLSSLDADGRASGVACRYGGEEFGIVLPGSGIGGPLRQRALDLAESVRAGVADIRLEDTAVTVSVGVAVFPEDGDTIDSLLDALDDAVASSVEAGGNRVSPARTSRDDAANELR